MAKKTGSHGFPLKCIRFEMYNLLIGFRLPKGQRIYLNSE